MTFVRHSFSRDTRHQRRIDQIATYELATYPIVDSKQKGHVMPIKSSATTTWNGTLIDGNGSTRLATSGAATLPVNWKARSAGSESITTPEELLAAAHASCYAMALSHALTENGATPPQLDVTVTVSFQPGEGVLGSHIQLTGEVPGLALDAFSAAAEYAKLNCPISQALSIPLTLAIELG